MTPFNPDKTGFMNNAVNCDISDGQDGAHTPLEFGKCQSESVLRLLTSGW